MRGQGKLPSDASETFQFRPDRLFVNPVLFNLPSSSDDAIKPGHWRAYAQADMLDLFFLLLPDGCKMARVSAPLTASTNCLRGQPRDRLGRRNYVSIFFVR